MRPIPSSACAFLLLAAGCTPAVPTPSATPGATSTEAVPIPSLPGGAAKPEGTPEDHVARAEKQIADGQYDGAFDTLEKALLLDARNRDVLRLLARTGWAASDASYDEDPAHAYRRIVSAGAYLRNLQDYYPDLTDEEKQLRTSVLFAEATAHARSLRVEETTGALREAIAAGFSDFDRIDKNPDWAAIREQPQFRKEYDQMRPAPADASPKPE